MKWNGDPKYSFFCINRPDGSNFRVVRQMHEGSVVVILHIYTNLWPNILNLVSLKQASCGTT